MKWIHSNYPLLSSTLYPGWCKDLSTQQSPQNVDRKSTAGENQWKVTRGSWMEPNPLDTRNLIEYKRTDNEAALVSWPAPDLQMSRNESDCGHQQWSLLAGGRKRRDPLELIRHHGKLDGAKQLPSCHGDPTPSGRDQRFPATLLTGTEGKQQQVSWHVCNFSTRSTREVGSRVRVTAFESGYEWVRYPCSATASALASPAVEGVPDSLQCWKR